jgi:hypothetical protein
VLAIEPLSSLIHLDRTLLYMFLAGPGYGEGIAIALPETGTFALSGDGELLTWS